VIAYTVLIGLVGLERVAELVVSVRNRRWSLAHGAVEAGAGHYPAMVALHTGLLAGCLIEVWTLDRPFLPLLGWTMLMVALISQGLRWWCISVLGRQWNTRIVVIAGAGRVTAGPYRWLAHPNYLAVVLEGLALPLVHSAWITAVGFTLLNAGLLAVRIRSETAALRLLRVS
jgi:methyltransferase